MNPFKSKVTVLRIGLLLPLTLGVWWLLLEPVTIPLLKLLAGSILEYIFSYDGLKIKDNTSLIWTIDTNYIFEGQAKLSTLGFEMNFITTTLGFPLLWLYCLNFHQRPQVLNILSGTAVLFILINLAVVLKVNRQIHFMMTEGDIFRQFLGIGNIVPIDMPSDIWVQFLLLVTPILSYAVIVIFPAAFCYQVNREVILEVLIGHSPRN